MAPPPIKLLILPGLDGTDVFFRPLLAALPASIRARVLCFPQHGNSSYAHLLTLARTALAEEGECYVLGSSFSGPLALMLAAAEPAKVRGIILCATFLASPRPTLSRYGWAAHAPLIWLLRTARRLPVWFGKRRTDPWRIAKAETWIRARPAGLASRLRAIARVDARPALHACPQPLLCVAFSEDSVVPASVTHEIARLRPNTQLVTLPGGHFAMFSDPQPLSREVARFLTSHRT
jgi:pimeloyl-ACP methyl ester carboxylesterase